MEIENLVQRLKIILAETAGLAPAVIDPRLPLLRGGLELDSLTAAAFLSAVEGEFGVDILEEDLTLTSLESLAAMADYIQENKR